ncbi:hypothetical protein ILUMI_01832 [Ignelater luminosus]|uniref:C-factor n=1 Tax=Ignelater luminosus TaxID=2038154 RepID=A0A8K0GH18_IGNLU|nr:hypothetical protein ILUMI_01832 [Ignelater luminosus]
MNTILITGCNRGLGLGLVKNLTRDPNPPIKLIATCRDTQKAEELRSIAEQHKNVHILELDVRHFDRYKEFSQKVSDIVKDDGLNVLFNNAGISPKFTRLNLVKLEQMMDTLTANTVAPIMLTKSLLPLLKKASLKNSDQPMGIRRAAIINMSSMLGSVELNTTGGLYPYRCSKSALNIATRSMSFDLKSDGILVTCLHPGWVKTDMGGVNATMEIDDSTSSIVKLLLKLEEKHNGGFYQYDGEPMPW